MSAARPRERTLACDELRAPRRASQPSAASAERFRAPKQRAAALSVASKRTLIVLKVIAASPPGRLPC